MADRLSLVSGLLAWALLLPAGAWAQHGALADPTRPPPGVDSGAPAVEAGASLLQSVLIPKKGRPVAVIGGQTVPLGGKYGDSTLTAVFPLTEAGEYYYCVEAVVDGKTLLYPNQAGASIRQGWHHSAQKSTSTGVSASMTSSLKVAWVTSTGALMRTVYSAAR